MSKIKFKWAFISLVILCILSIGCRNEDVFYKGNEYIEGQDQQYMFLNDAKQSTMARSEAGYYFFAGFYLYYMDLESMKPIIMCNKPNCLHCDEKDAKKRLECSALFLDNSFLAYNNGSLYATQMNTKDAEDRMELVKIDTNTTNRQSVFEFDKQITEIIMHRGIMYYGEYGYNNHGECQYAMKSIPINKLDSKPKQVFEGELLDGRINNLKGIGNNIYFNDCSISNSSYIDRVMRYDISKEKITRILSDNDNILPQGISVVGEKLYYILYSDDSSIEENKKVYKANLDGSNKEFAFDLDVLAYMRSDGENIIINDLFGEGEKSENEKSIGIYNTDRELKGEFFVDELSPHYTSIVGDDKYIFISDPLGEYYEMKAIDKQKLLKGEVEVKDLFEIEINKLNPVIQIKE